MYLSFIHMQAEASYGERVPYVVVYGEPGSRLVDQVCDPPRYLSYSFVSYHIFSHNTA